jgi:hypothetical protein
MPRDPKEGPGNSLIALIGTIHSITLDQDPRFILSNDDGLFSVHLRPQEVPNLTLQQGTEMCVVGRLTTYYDRRRQIHKFIVQAARVTPYQENGSITAWWPAQFHFLFKQITEYILRLPFLASDGSSSFMETASE